MTKIDQISSDIREALHDSTITKTNILLNKDKGFWDQLWTCLDTIGDTELAVKSFNDSSPESFYKSSYLQTYGLLQALYLQQDAVNNLKESVLGKKINWEKEHPDVFLVRTIRNESIGHPTKNAQNKLKKNIYCVIDRSSLSKEGFSYVMWSSDSFSKKSIKFSELISKQEDALFKELSGLSQKIKDEEVEHKKKFDGDSLSKYLPDDEPYSLTLLRRAAYDQLGWVGVKQYKVKYEEIKKGIEARYGKINDTLRIPGTKLVIDQLDRIFQRIEELKKSDEDVEIDISIYADALVENLKELKTHLDEIDEEFSKKDKSK